MIGFRAALVLFLLLMLAAFVTLKGKFLYLALIIVGALLAKSALHEFKSRIK